MLVLVISEREDIVLSDRQTGDEIVRIVFTDKQPEGKRATRLGFDADYDISINRIPAKKFETAGAAM